MNTNKRPHRSGKQSVRETAGIIVLLLALLISGGWYGCSESEPHTGPAAPAETGAASQVLTKQELLLASLQLRRLASQRFADAVASIRAEVPLRFMTAIPDYQANSDAWSFFFTGSYLLIGAADQPHPVTAYYNPLHDAAIIIRWGRRSDDSMMIESGTLVTGRWENTLPAGQKSHVPRWLEGSAAPPDRLRDQTRSWVEAFERIYPRDGGQSASPLPTPTPELVESVFEWGRMQMESVVALRQPGLKGLRQEVDRFRQTLVTGTPAEFAALLPASRQPTAQVLAQTPLTWRAHLTPLLVMPGQESRAVILGDPQSPGFYVFAHFDRSEKPALKSLSFSAIGDLSGGAQ